jgi:hypothetical protein
MRKRFHSWTVYWTGCCAASTEIYKYLALNRATMHARFILIDIIVAFPVPNESRQILTSSAQVVSAYLGGPT